MLSMTTSKPRKFQKFVALDERDNPLWGTMENSPEEAKERFDRFNPDPTGEGHGEVIAEVSITLKVLA